MFRLIHQTGCTVGIDEAERYHNPKDPAMMALMGNAVDKTADGQWIGHVLKRLYLIDEARRKRQTDGIVYVISPLEVVDMMRRYDVTPISVDNTKNPS